MKIEFKKHKTRISYHVLWQFFSFSLFFFDLICELVFFKKSKKVWFYGCIFNIFLFSDEQESEKKKKKEEEEEKC
jgi:uncharacterized membrane protein